MIHYCKVLKKICNWSVFLILIAPFLVIIYLTPPVVTAQPSNPSATIFLEDNEKTAKVGPEQHGVVTLLGWVSAEVISGTSMVVQLNATDTWNSAIISPSAVQFTSDNADNKEFQVSIQVPKGESCDTEGTVVVSGRWMMYPGRISGDCEPVERTIKVAQYHIFSISSNKLQIETALGSKAKFNLVIENQGNGEETFSIDIKNLDELADKGFVFELPSYRPTAKAGQETTYEFFVNTPSDLRYEGPYNIDLEVSPYTGNNEDVPTEKITFKLVLKSENFLFSQMGFIILFAVIPVFIIGLLFFIWRKRQRRGNKI